MAKKCPSRTIAGEPCKGNPLPGRPYCLAHDPEAADRRAEGSRKGGEARANAKRAARQWAAIGEQLSPAQLPAMLRACLISVRDGTMEPAQASAIAGLAKTSVQLSHDLELEARIAALEAVIDPQRGAPTIRRIG
jgi:hypothetical protein